MRAQGQRHRSTPWRSKPRESVEGERPNSRAIEELELPRICSAMIRSCSSAERWWYVLGMPQPCGLGGALGS